MARKPTQRMDDSRRERGESPMVVADGVAAGLAAAGLGMALLDDRAAAADSAPLVRPEHNDARSDMPAGTDRVSVVHQQPANDAAPNPHDVAPSPHDKPSAEHGTGSVPLQADLPARHDPAANTAGERSTGHAEHDATPAIADSGAPSAYQTNPPAMNGTATPLHHEPSNSATAAPPFSEGTTASLSSVIHSVSDTVHETLQTTSEMLHDTLDHGIEAVSTNIQSLGASIDATVTGSLDRITSAVDDLTGSIAHAPALTQLASLPGTLLGGSTVTSHADGVLANAFTPVSSIAANTSGASHLFDALHDISFDAVPMHLGFIGQSYTDAASAHDMHSGGLLHGLI